jgi:uncharacterized protein DUF4232
VAPASPTVSGMSRNRRAAAVSPLLLVALAGCGTSAPAPTHPSARGSVPCTASALRISLGAAISPATGEHADRFVLTNRSARSCVLHGYPRVALHRGGRRLPFAYRRGGGQYTTARRPKRVLLRPGSRAFFLVAKYRCDRATIGTASGIRVRTPKGAWTLRLRLPANAGPGTLDYCRSYPGDRRPAPGNEVEVSPLTASASAVLPP